MAAVDLGAQSGRVAVGRFDGEKLRCARCTGSRTRPCAGATRSSWDVAAAAARRARRLAGAGRDAVVDSVAVDSWAVDFGLLDARRSTRRRTPTALPRRPAGCGGRARFRPRARARALPAHRHPAASDQHDLRARRRWRPSTTRLEARSDAAPHPRPLPLLALRQQDVRAHERDDDPVLRPDRRRLGGRPPASASMFRPRCFPRSSRPGTRLGPLAPEAADGHGLGRADVVAVATHDTGSAVAGGAVAEAGSVVSSASAPGRSSASRSRGR